MSRLVLAIKCFFLVLFARRLPVGALALLPESAPPEGAAGEPQPTLPPPEARVVGPTVASQPVTTEAVPVAPSVQATPTVDEAKLREEGALLLLGVLQREGRLVDFLFEAIEGASDDQLGAAVRVIHAGCRKALDEHIRIEPVRPELEGQEIQVEAGFDPSRIRLAGNVAGNPPFRGQLVHPGWRGTELRLPTLPAQHDRSVIAPAEVEL